MGRRNTTIAIVCATALLALMIVRCPIPDRAPSSQCKQLCKPGIVKEFVYSTGRCYCQPK